MAHIGKKKNSTRLSRLYILLLAIVPASIFILTIPVKFDRFLFEEPSLRVYANMWFEDLDLDGEEELMHMGTNPDSTVNLYLYKDGQGLIDQFNFKYHHPVTVYTDFPITLDIDEDQFREIIFFSQKADSLFLNIFSYKELDLITDSYFVTTIGGFNGKRDYRIYLFGSEDVDGDSVKELYFSVSAGFSLYPRRIFRFDFLQDTLSMSINTGTSFYNFNPFKESDGGRFFATGIALGNTSENYPYPYLDTSNWILVFDMDLNLVNTPWSLGSYPNMICGPPAIIGDNAYFIFKPRMNYSENSRIYRMDMDGNLVDSLVTGKSLTFNIYNITYNGKLHFYVNEEKTFQAIFFNPENLEFEKSPGRLRMLNGKMLKYVYDMNGDGRMEYILQQVNNNRVFIYPGNLKNPVIIDSFGEPILKASVKHCDGIKKGELILSATNKHLVYPFSENPYYLLKYLFWVFVYGVSVLFVGAVSYLQNQRIEKMRRIEQEITSLQLQNFKNQLDPHFTFNALNSVGYAIYKENKDKAYDLFQRFTTMIRSVLVDSQDILRSLDQEIEFTLNYLEFQKIRFRDLFDYSFEVAPGIKPDQVMIPRMLIQGYAENAVKHAFYELDYTGQLDIIVRPLGEDTLIIIEDNGLGINRSREQGSTSGTGKGLQFLNDQVAHINKLYNLNITINILDKSENGNGRGTRIEVRV